MKAVGPVAARFLVRGRRELEERSREAAKMVSLHGGVGCSSLSWNWDEKSYMIEDLWGSEGLVERIQLLYLKHD